MKNKIHIHVPDIPRYLKNKTWFTQPGLVIQCSDEKGRPIKKGSLVNLYSDQPAKLLFFKIPGMNPEMRTTSIYLKTDDRGCVTLPEIYPDELGIVRLFISVGNSIIERQVEVVDILPPRLTHVSTTIIKGDGEPNQTIQVMSALNNQILANVSSDEQGVFYLKNELSIFGSDCWLKVFVDQKYTAKPKLEELIQMSPLSEIRKVTEENKVTRTCCFCTC